MKQHLNKTFVLQEYNVTVYLVFTIDNDMCSCCVWL